MKLLETGAQGIEQRADEVAEAACHLADEARPHEWSAGAVEDGLEAIDVLSATLAQISPEAARILADIPRATAALRRALDIEEPPADQPAKGGLPPQRTRTKRRGLGHGWQGVRILEKK